MDRPKATESVPPSERHPIRSVGNVNRKSPYSPLDNLIQLMEVIECNGNRICHLMDLFLVDMTPDAIISSGEVNKQFENR
jgi:hypothetical protein